MPSAKRPNPTEQSRFRPHMRALGRLTIVSCYAYPALLIGLWLGFVFVGERWWLTATSMYAPRAVFLVPSLFLGGALWLMRRRRLLWTQGVALLVVMFPLMGLALPPLHGAASSPSFKLMSFNVDQERGGKPQILQQIDALEPDVVLLQEIGWGDALLLALRERYPHAEVSNQFIIASRYPILDRTDPAKIPHYGRDRSPRFMRYLLETPLGKLAVYSLHPISPRGSLGISRFRGQLHRLRTGELLGGDPETDINQNASLRLLQIRAAADLAAKEKYPVLLAGDTNLPGLSAALHSYLSDYKDAFQSASAGFGYTFPSKYPFLRLDRIMAGAELGFSDFQVGCPNVSDHLCVSVRVFHR